MKILVFSDIHGSISSLNSMIREFENGNYDLMINAGDFINHGPRNGLPENFDQKACVEVYNQYRSKIIGVRGNCDSEVDQMLINFPILSDYAQIFTEKMRIFVHHGHKAEYSAENLSKFLPASDEKTKTVVISGHTHIPVFEETDGYVFLNPGSITFPKGGVKSGFISIDTESSEIKFTEV